VTFTVSATGTTPLSYQWRFGSTNIADATASSYTRVNVQASHAGNYSVIVANSAGSLTSSNATLTVVVPPIITAQPQNQTATQGLNATFTVTASGTGPLTYQWLFNAVNIDGATSSAYTRSNVQPTDAGAYSALVTNPAGAATSSNAMLSLFVPRPVLTIGPPVIIRWRGLSNFSYSVQTKTDWDGTDWTTAGTASSPTTEICFTNQNNNELQQFFRVVHP